ncbi:MAG: hypothetical protein IKK93_01145 [Campylobacter sp.]|nr:hypothetical protein [Campylobacter sp.]
MKKDKKEEITNFQDYLFKSLEIFYKNELDLQKQLNELCLKKDNFIKNITALRQFVKDYFEDIEEFFDNPAWLYIIHFKVKDGNLGSASICEDGNISCSVIDKKTLEYIKNIPLTKNIEEVLNFFIEIS